MATDCKHYAHLLPADCKPTRKNTKSFRSAVLQLVDEKKLKLHKNVQRETVCLRVRDLDPKRGVTFKEFHFAENCKYKELGAHRSRKRQRELDDPLNRLFIMRWIVPPTDADKSEYLLEVRTTSAAVLLRPVVFFESADTVGRIAGIFGSDTTLRATQWDHVVTVINADGETDEETPTESSSVSDNESDSDSDSNSE